MLKRWFLYELVLLVLAGLWAGCRTAAPAPKAPSASGSAPAAPASDNSGVTLAQAHAHYSAGVIAEMHGDESAALDEYQKAALDDPSDEALVLEVSRRFLQKKQPEKALDLLKGAAAQPKASGLVLARLGLVYSQLGKTDQAVAADRAAIKRSPHSLSGYQNLFVTLAQNHQEQEGFKVLDDAARQSPVDEEFLLGVSELYANLALQAPPLKDKCKERGLAVLRRADQLKPSNPTAQLRLADGFNAFSDWPDAARLYEQLLRNLPDLALHRENPRTLIHAKLADIYRRTNDSKKAKEHIEALLQDDATNPQAYYWLGRILLEERKPEDAADQFSKAILLQPSFEQGYYDLAIAQLESRKPARALETLEEARKKFRQSFVLEFLTGMAFGGQKAYAQALEHYNDAEAMAKAGDPSRLDSDFYYQFGAACERKGDLAQAEKYFDHSLQLKPDFAEALNYLGYMWAEHGLKLEKARTLIEKAVKIEPKNPAYLDSLGWVLFKLNQTKEALDYALKAAQLSEAPDATILDHLGDIYSALKQPDKAREAWTKSLALEPNDEVQKKLGGH